MELRHLRYFLAVAEELHFARAAERLHIDQSPLSRAVKELEEELGARLFVRTTRSTQLTRAGRLFLEHVPRVFASIEQARDSVRSAANGFHGQLRIALSDGITPSRLPALLAQCREEDPEVEVRLCEVPLALVYMVGDAVVFIDGQSVRRRVAAAVGKEIKANEE